MIEKNVTKRVLIILIGASIILGLLNSAYAANIVDYRNYSRLLPDNITYVSKPIANFQLIVKKPDGSNRYTEPTNPETGTALAYDVDGC
jgi:hypothetical protein